MQTFAEHSVMYRVESDKSQYLQRIQIVNRLSFEGVKKYKAELKYAINSKKRSQKTNNHFEAS